MVEEVLEVATRMNMTGLELAAGLVAKDLAEAKDLADRHHHMVAVVDLEGTFSVLPADSFYLAVYLPLFYYKLYSLPLSLKKFMLSHLCLCVFFRCM